MKTFLFLFLLSILSGCSIAPHCDQPVGGYSNCHVTVTTPDVACTGSCAKK